MTTSPLGADVSVRAVRDHYDRLSGLYQRFWGDHIHHGLWEADESVAQAQVNLLVRLATAAAVREGERVLDVGCGLGGSALWLAEHYGCSVTGITISPVQVEIARRRAAETGWAHRLRFECVDANALGDDGERYDLVWSIECTEHLEDKAKFIRTAAGLLRPGGRLAICAWLADPKTEAARELVAAVCEGMVCPSLASGEDYAGWMGAAGLEVRTKEDLTRQVERTWHRASAILDRPEVKAILAVSSAATRRFARAFAGIDRAYATGAMSYGLLVAQKPPVLST